MGLGLLEALKPCEILAVEVIGVIVDTLAVSILMEYNTNIYQTA
jgi:hypothetical protein